MTFDKYFNNFPSIKKDSTFVQFWENAITELKQYPIESEIELNKQLSTSRHEVYDCSFKSFSKATIFGKLYISKKNQRTFPVIVLPDYNNKNNFTTYKKDSSITYLFMELRGHHVLKVTAEITPGKKEPTPGYMTENLLDVNNYYVKYLYLDVLRAIDFLRLQKAINCQKIAIYGKGLGSACAIFTAAVSDRIAAICIDSPSFADLKSFQNISVSDAANEINEYITDNKSKSVIVKKNLNYFDALNFIESITCPVMMAVGLKDKFSPPECSFGIFNHLLCEKIAEVYPEEGNTAGGEAQFIKAITFFKKYLTLDY